MMGGYPHPTLSQRERTSYSLSQREKAFYSLSLWERVGVRALGTAILLTTLLLSACGTPNACLANRYDGAAPQLRCISGLQLPYGVLKDNDPMSGSTAPVDPAL